MTDVPSSPSHPPAVPPAAPTRAPPQPPLSPPARTPLTIPPISTSIEAFFTRCGLPPAARQLCWDFIDSHYPSTASSPIPVYECPNQGYCSYTLCIGDSQIIQFRPRAHQLNTTLALLAREVYGVLAPETRFLGVLPIPSDGQQTFEPLFVYSMTCMPGVSLTDFRRNVPSRSAGEVRLQRAILVRDFARFLSLGWKNRQPSGLGKAGLPFQGRLAGSLRLRLEMMRDKLPPRFRPIVVDVLKDLDRIEALPWVLTHGDVVSDNVMVEGNGGHRGTGCEYLPFGIGLYGAEELFGQSVRSWDGRGADGPQSRFAYYPEAGDLRRLFWQELEGAIPPLATDLELRGTVEQARLLGILLWHGFAFDDGRIDRVVQEERDEAEVQRLDMFLFGTNHPLTRGDAEFRIATAGEKDGRREEVKKPLVTVAETETEKKGAKRRGGYLIRRISSMIL
ncbi:hypothetical protein BR93DRAFT_972609 [Coniochaeta sp. PMI_546]|nr:hypothetical protein BR93DRAFT_972609 [Coniochaeta sp. PMI_546]